MNHKYAKTEFAITSSEHGFGRRYGRGAVVDLDEVVDPRSGTVVGNLIDHTWVQDGPIEEEKE